MREVSIYKIEYVLGREREVWVAYMCAFSQEEALQHLSKTIKRPIANINFVSRESRVDAITDPVRDLIIGISYGTPLEIPEEKPTKETKKKVYGKKKEESTEENPTS